MAAVPDGNPSNSIVKPIEFGKIDVYHFSDHISLISLIKPIEFDEIGA